MSKNISNWPDPECKDRILAKIIHFYSNKGILKKKLKTTEAHEYAKNITKYFSFINFDDICQKHLKLG